MRLLLPFLFTLTLAYIHIPLIRFILAENIQDLERTLNTVPGAREAITQNFDVHPLTTLRTAPQPFLEFVQDTVSERMRAVVKNVLAKQMRLRAVEKIDTGKDIQ
jgi:hypothetical protein